MWTFHGITVSLYDHLQILSARVQKVHFWGCDFSVGNVGGEVVDDGSIRTSCRNRGETQAPVV